MESKIYILRILAVVLFLCPLITITRAQDSLYLIGTIIGESSEHQINYPIGVGDVNGDGFDDFMLTRKTGVTMDPTVVELYLGSPNFDLNADVIFHFPGNYYYHYLDSGCGIGDVNNDGYDDFVLSGTIGPMTTSKAFLYYGGETIDTIPVCELTPPYTYERFGSMERLGDLNRDGFNDFGISSFNWDTYKGNVYLFWGGDSISWENSITLSSDTILDFFGSSLANIGDINNDGFDDIAVGAPYAIVGSGTGKVYIYFGGPNMDDIPDTILVAEENEFGTIIRNAGDLNSDGTTDFCIASYNKIYIYLTQLNTPLEIEGYSIDGNGDINKDGYDDLIVGDDWKIKIYFGSDSFDTTYDMSIDDADPVGFTVNISFAGDINNDGYDEIFAFAPYYPEPDLGKLFIYSYKNPSEIKNPGIKVLFDFQLYQNYPNPFNPVTIIIYQLTMNNFVTLKVYNTLGEEVATLVNERQPAGTYEVKFDGSNLSSGVYIYRLIAGEYSAARKMLLLK